MHKLTKFRLQYAVTEMWECGAKLRFASVTTLKIVSLLTSFSNRKGNRTLYLKQVRIFHVSYEKWPGPKLIQLIGNVFILWAIDLASQIYEGDLFVEFS